MAGARSASRIRFLARRFAALVVVVLLAQTLAFFALSALPGDPARALVGPQASARDVARAREIYALGEPVGPRYLAFWRRLLHRAPGESAAAHASCAELGLGLHLDLGFSFHYRRPVAALLAERIPRSLELALAALAVQLALGLAAGAAAASRRGGMLDGATTSLTLLGISAPTFVTGLLLQHVLSHRLGLLPYDGYGTTSGERLASIVLPALTLGIFGAALYARVVREELGAALDAEHARAARARGASGLRVLFAHGFRNALGPVATLAALDLGALAGGAIVTERLFRWPGVGQMAVEALVSRDLPLILGTVLFSAVAAVTATFLLDVFYALVDPRAGRPS